MATNFTKELLTEIPNARDIWAAHVAGARHLQMTAYDVGGSRTGNRPATAPTASNVQNQTRDRGHRHDGRHGANAGYFDFGSFEEFSGRWRGRRRIGIRGRRGTEHQREVRRRSLLRQLVQRLGRRLRPSPTTSPTTCRSPTARRRRLLRAQRPQPRQPDRSAVRHQLQRRRTALEGRGLVVLQLSPERSVQVRSSASTIWRARS